MKSWKTTVAGVLALVGGTLAQFFPQYAAHGGFLAAIGAGLGLIFARDNNVSTEEVRGKASPAGPVLPVLLALVMLGGAGCATTQTPGRILATTAQTVDAAMVGWQEFAWLKPATEQDHAAVAQAYAVYQLSFAVAKSAQTSGDTAGWARAAEVLRANQSALLLLLETLSKHPQ